ncbi:glucosamine kinase [Litoreibacter halocynthiae]|uniref:Glucosamine kinase n=1 Tax=Litoreibacter halocynthiae TaxID=1242689 RepID=A0A4R7LML7_9RHOB|nr:BadF/BadG/BcrA/BcrD ATPase family protein [Litoreibacter halocynthiae]TDT75380.1 glucosamine kinase [Litoreibacter halocynthiae]
MINSGDTVIIGVDGGGTGCRVAIGTSSDGVLSRAEGGRANAASDAALAVKNIVFTVEDAARLAGISEAALSQATAHIGIAGILGTEDSARIASALPYKTITVTDDRPTAVTGALGNQDGYLLSVGTGAFAAANKAGEFTFLGGWGFYVADQGSGAWLGRAGLEQVMLCHDGLADHTPLTRALFEKFGGDPNELVSFSMSAKPGDFATLAPDIIAGAHAEDPWGQAIMKKGADHLIRCLARLGFRTGDTLCLTGGIGPHYAGYLPESFLSGRMQPLGSALDGAFQLASSNATQQLESN